MTEQEYLVARLDDQIDWYSKKSRNNQWWYKKIKKTEMLLSGSIPIAID